MKNYKLILLIVITISSISCKQIVSFTVTTSESRDIANRYRNMKGSTENQILRTLSTPTYINSDGAGGKILVYEDRQVITDQNSAYTTKSNTSGNATTTVGQNIWTGAPQANTNASSSTTTQHNSAGRAVTYEDRTYVSFFINTKGICYDVLTNIDTKRTTKQVCYKAPKAMNSGWLWTLCPPLTIIGIPVSIAYLCTVIAERTWKPSEKDRVQCK